MLQKLLPVSRILLCYCRHFVVIHGEVLCLFDNSSFSFLPTGILGDYFFGHLRQTGCFERRISRCRC